MSFYEYLEFLWAFSTFWPFSFSFIKSKNLPIVYERVNERTVKFVPFLYRTSTDFHSAFLQIRKNIREQRNKEPVRRSRMMYSSAVGKDFPLTEKQFILWAGRQKCLSRTSHAGFCIFQFLARWLTAAVSINRPTNRPTICCWSTRWKWRVLVQMCNRSYTYRMMTEHKQRQKWGHRPNPRTKKPHTFPHYISNGSQTVATFMQQCSKNSTTNNAATPHPQSLRLLRKITATRVVPLPEARTSRKIWAFWAAMQCGLHTLHARLLDSHANKAAAAACSH